MNSKLPLTLAIFGKNNEDSLSLCIDSMKDIVEEIVFVDTGSSDKTVEIARSYNARIYGIGFSDFGNVRSLTAHLATQPWILGLDTDEIICPEERDFLSGLIFQNDKDVWGLPRRRWSDINREHQTEISAYPDYQYRLLRNIPSKIRWDNRVHERLVVREGIKIGQATAPHIEHFQDVFKKKERMKERNNLYRKLYTLDEAAGVIHSLPPVASIDEEE